MPEKSFQLGTGKGSSGAASAWRDPYLLIVFDWDDTLFPTTWSINDSSCSDEARGWLEDAYVVLTKEANKLFVLENDY